MAATSLFDSKAAQVPASRPAPKTAGPWDLLLSQEVIFFSFFWVLLLTGGIVWFLQPNRGGKVPLSLFENRPYEPEASAGVPLRQLDDSTALLAGQNSPNGPAAVQPAVPAARFSASAVAENALSPAAAAAVARPSFIKQAAQNYAASTSASAPSFWSAAKSGLSMFIEANRSDRPNAGGRRAPGAPGQAATAESVREGAASQADGINRGPAADPAGPMSGGAQAAASSPAFTAREGAPSVNPQTEESRNGSLPDSSAKKSTSDPMSPSMPSADSAASKPGPQCQALAALNAKNPENAVSATPSRTADGIALCRQQMAVALHDLKANGGISRSDYDQCLASCAKP